MLQVTAPVLLGALALVGAVGGTWAAGPSLPSASVVETAPLESTDGEVSLAGRDPLTSRSANRNGGVDADPTVERLATTHSRALEKLGRHASQRARELEAQRWVLPVSSYRLTGTFGEQSYLWSTVHTGLDFAAPSGTAIQAIAAGSVAEAGWAGAYGYRTIVTLVDGTEIWYCHQSRVDVTPGESVGRGQVIGAVGSTGNVTGPHLHLEVRPGGGEPVDPQVALPEHGAFP